MRFLERKQGDYDYLASKVAEVSNYNPSTWPEPSMEDLSVSNMQKLAYYDSLSTRLNPPQQEDLMVCSVECGFLWVHPMELSP